MAEEVRNLTREEFLSELAAVRDLEALRKLRDTVSSYIPVAEKYEDFLRADIYYGWMKELAVAGADLQRVAAEAEAAIPEPIVEPEPVVVEPVTEEPEDEAGSELVIVKGDIENGEWVEAQRELETDYPNVETQEEFPDADR